MTKKVIAVFYILQREDILAVNVFVYFGDEVPFRAVRLNHSRLRRQAPLSATGVFALWQKSGWYHGSFMLSSLFLGDGGIFCYRLPPNRNKPNEGTHAAKIKMR